MNIKTFMIYILLVASAHAYDNGKVYFPYRNEEIKPFLDFTKQWEGYRQTVYQCGGGYKTIGIGHKIKSGETFGRLSNEQVYEIYMGDMKQAISDAMKLVPNFKTLPIQVKLILVDMSFNLGYTRLAKFEKTLDACKNHDWQRMADEMQNSLWYKQVGKRSKNHVATLRRMR